MTTATNEFQPDYAVPPGWVVEERLDAQDMSHAEFARRCGRSPKLISEIIAGKAPVEPKTALQFEKVLGVAAGIWLGIEKDYRLHLAREAEARTAEDTVAWAKTFPVAELTKRGAIDKPSSTKAAVPALLSFFRVASVDAWHVKYGMKNVAYRHSPSFESDESSLATWLRLAEIDAEAQARADFDASEFRKALRQMRQLTREPVGEAINEARTLCNRAGVALALVKPLPGMRLSGAAWWPSPGRPVIALSARHKTDDHLWFSFFHEAAHILLHSKKGVFIDGESSDGDAVETAANDWAADWLMPPAAWERFVAAGVYHKTTVCSVANRQGIAPGIVVGRLQHEGRVPWRSQLNALKVRLRWADDPAR